MSIKLHIAMHTVLAVGILATPAAAFPYVAKFMHEPTGYRVYVRDSGPSMILSGVQNTTGKTFKLRVTSGGRVTGNYEGRNVDYYMDKDTDKAVVRASN